MLKSVGTTLVGVVMVAVALVAPAGSAAAAYRYDIPTGLQSTAQAEKALTLDWDDVVGATKYRVQISEDPSMSGASYHRFDSSGGTISGLSKATVYYFRVAVIDPVSGGKLSDYTQKPYASASTTASGTSHVSGYAQAIPTGLRTTGQTASTLSLSWDAVSGAELYRVQLSKSASMSGASYHRFDKSDGTISGLVAGTTYYFRVAVIDPVSGDKLSDYTQKPYPSSSTTAPGSGYALPIPGGLRSTASSATSLTLDWDDVTGAQEYRVQLSKSASMSGASYHRFDKSDGTISGLVAGTTYYFRVAVIDPGSGAKASDYTQKPYPSSSTTAPGSGYALPIPTGLRSSQQSATSLTLDWDDVTGAQEYRVQLSKSASMSGAAYHRFSSSAGVVDGLSKSTTYYFRVAVIDPVSGDKLSDYTQKPYPSISTTTPASGYALPIPTGLRSSQQSATSLTLDWDDVAGAKQYRVQLSKDASMSGATYHRFDASVGTISGLSKSTTYYFRVAVIDPVSGAKLSDYTQKPYPSVKTPASDAGGSSDVTVGSFNIGGVDTDKNASGDHKVWRERRSAVVDDIISEGVDVVGVQEANQSTIHADNLVDGANQFLDLRNGLRDAGKDFRLTNEKYYNCERHTSSTNCSYVDQGASHATRILYDAGKLTLVDEGSFLYANQSPGKTERYLVWAVLKDNATGDSFFFTNTHLDPYDANVRKREWQELIAQSKQLNTRSLPVISVGDFNSSKWNQPAGDMLSAMKAAGFSDVLGQEYQVNPPRAPRALKIINGYFNSFNDFQRDLDGGSKCYCSAQSKIGNGIDYIFATNSLVVKEFKIVLDVNASFDLVGTIPSDHHMLKAIVTLP